MITAPPGYVARFRHAEHDGVLEREVVAFDEDGTALVVDSVGGRLVPILHLGDGWEFAGLDPHPHCGSGRSRPEAVEERYWCEARPDHPEVVYTEEDEEALEEMSNTVTIRFVPERETKMMWRFVEQREDEVRPRTLYVRKSELDAAFGGVPDNIRIEIYAVETGDG